MICYNVNGFDDPKIYNDELLKLSEVELREFDDLERLLVIQSKQEGNIDINKEGFNEEETEEEKKKSFFTTRRIS